MADETTYEFRETKNGLVLLSAAGQPLREGGFATIFAIEGNQQLMKRQGWPERVVDLIVHKHLKGDHQFDFAVPAWNEFAPSIQQGWTEEVAEANPPSYR